MQLRDAVRRHTDAPAIALFGRRVRMAMGGRNDEPDAAPTSTPLPPEVEFVGYAEDCLLVGHIRLDAARLSDLLNDHDEFELVDVRVESLAGDRAVEVHDVVVQRDELLAVHAVGPRGERERRVRTTQHPLALQVGPYEVHGYLHALPGVDPISSFRHRRTMVPLTEARIEYEQGGVRRRQRAATVVINRHQVDWVVEGDDDQVEMPDIPLTHASGPMLKDFTGNIVGADRG